MKCRLPWGWKCPRCGFVFLRSRLPTLEGAIKRHEARHAASRRKFARRFIGATLTVGLAVVMWTWMLP